MDGSAHLQCNPDGSCKCKDHVSGDKCDQIQDGYYDLADPKGSIVYSEFMQFHIFKRIIQFTCAIIDKFHNSLKLELTNKIAVEIRNHPFYRMWLQPTGY